LLLLNEYTLCAKKRDLHNLEYVVQF